jgi:hypothetical protein
MVSSPKHILHNDVTLWLESHHFPLPFLLQVRLIAYQITNHPPQLVEPAKLILRIRVICSG